MQFIHGSLLVGLIALVIPIFIHLFYRQKPKPVAIPTLMFIEQAIIESSSSRKLKSSLLLLMRMLLIALPVLLLAQPYFPGIQDSDASKHVIIIDNSFYNSKNLDVSKEIAIEILNNIPEGNPVKLAGTQFEDRDFSFIHDELKARIKEITPQNGIVNFSQIINDNNDEEVQYHCVTDLNKKAWAGQLPKDKSVLYYEINPPRFNNYINSVTSPEKFTLNQESQFSVKLGGDMPFSGMKIQLWENDEIIREKTIPLNDSRNISINFEYTPKENDFSLEFRLIIDDQFDKDNSYFFVGKAMPPQKIYIVDNYEEDYISSGQLTQIILSQFPEYEIINIEANKIPEDGDFYFISENLQEREWQNLEKISILGKQLILWPNKSSDVEQWNRKILPLFSTDLNFGLSNRLRSSNKKLRDFEDELDQLKLSSSYFLNSSKSTSIQLQSFDRKEIISSSSWGSGKVTFCGLEINEVTLSSNFIAPLIYSMFQDQIDLNIYNLKCFHPINETPSGKFTITNPAGIKDSFENEIFDKTDIPGIYESDFGQNFAVNLPQSELIYEYLETPKEETLKAEEKGFSISSSLMMLVLLLLLLIFNLLELFISQRESA